MNIQNLLLKQKPGNCSNVKTFGIILFTDINPNIIKVLKDDDYWKSLDIRSGKEWMVFSIKPKNGEYSMPNPQPGVMCYMVPIWKEPNENKTILKELSLSSTKDCPLLLVFTEVDGEILQTKLKINDESVDSSYASLAELFPKIQMKYQK